MDIGELRTDKSLCDGFPCSGALAIWKIRLYMGCGTYNVWEHPKFLSRRLFILYDIY